MYICLNVHDSFVYVAIQLRNTLYNIVSYISHDSFTCVTWLTSKCGLTRQCVSHASFKLVTWLIHICRMNHSYRRHESSICMMWIIRTGDMTHPYVWYESFVYGTLPYMWHGSFICVTRLIHMCSLTHSCVTWLSQTCGMSLICMTRLIHTCGMTHSYVWHNSRLLRDMCHSNVAQ